jgi:threonine synthase
MSIWKYESVKRKLNSDNYITLNEGNTDLDKFDLENENSLFLKREDKNPTGSWKDRGTAFKITQLISQGKNEVVIPSSGNAAISLLTYANTLESFKVHVVVSPKLNSEKKAILEDLVKDRHLIHFDEKAKQAASRISAEKNIPILRASMDQDLLTGYWSLGFELSKFIIHNQDKENYIFFAVSSGTALVGTVQGLMQKLDDEFKMPKIIVCQTQSCHPIVDMFNSEGAVTSPRLLAHDVEDSLAEAIVDKSVLRSPQILNILKNTNGEAMTITNDELEMMNKFALNQLDLQLSYTSLLPLAAMMRLKDTVQNANFICITSGR